MQPFRELVKPNAKFEWNSSLEKIFSDSKEILIRQSTDGIQTFDPTRNTCLQTDWSKDGIGYLLLQQHCNCETAKAPVCCKDGWKLVFAGSRFTHPAETRYSPTEGEALAIAWSLEHARFFILGCEKLLVSTDHQALTGILRDRDLSSIRNPRILSLKERTLPYLFTIQHNPGKWHRGPDALSRNPTLCSLNIAEDDGEATDNCEDRGETHIIAAIIGTTNDPAAKPTTDANDVRQAAKEDPEYQAIISAIENGFPPRADKSCSAIRQYWNVRSKLSLHDNLATMDGRVVIPASCRSTILKNLHSAHQGVSKMMARARDTVYWPGIETAIRNTRYNCQRCNESAPSQRSEPLQLSPAPLYPFQQICMDFFQRGHHAYLSVVDRFSGWISVYHFPNRTTSSKLINSCRDLFATYGAPEEISTDGGLQFTSAEFQEFLKNWGTRHRLSSAEYPQSNGRAEASVKSAKKIIHDNTNPDGSLNNDRFARAILQHRNTPIPELGISPAQILFHRQLRDSIPTIPKHYQLHKEWITSAMQRETAFAKTNETAEDHFNKKAHPLPPLPVQTEVRVQSHGQWSKSGRIVEVLPNRQYRVRIDGSGRITLRNRKFLMPATTRTTTVAPLPSVDHSTMPTLSLPPAPSITGPHPESPPVLSPAPVAPHQHAAATQAPACH